MVKADKQASDPYDQYDHTSDTPTKNIEKNMSENEKLQKKISETFDGGCWQRAKELAYEGTIQAQ